MKASELTGRNKNTAIKALSRNIYKLAEEEVYNARANSRSAVSGDDIFDAAAKIMEQIQRNVVETIEKEHMGQE